MGRLTVNRVNALKEPGLYGDGGTLYLRVAVSKELGNVSKSWVQRIQINNRRHDLGLGGYPIVTLAEAREIAFDNRRKVHRGEDIVAERRKKAMPTFREAALETWEGGKAAGRWRSEKVVKTWWQQMERHAFNRLGELPVDQIGREDVLAVLLPLWTDKPEMGRKMRMRIRETLEWAQARGHVSENVAGEAINGALPKVRGKRGHMRAQQYQDVAGALETVAKSGASLAAKHCFAFTVLTAVRSGEARGATWAEIDLDAATWIIPGGRTKTGKEHRVPLSDAALAVLDQAAELRERQSDLVFPSPRGGKQLSDMTITKMLRTCGIDAHVHGYRSSFRDWCAETGKPREIAEAALAHVVPGVEGSYFRSDLFERRRVLMDQWAAYLSGSDLKVVRLRTGSQKP